MLLPDPPSADRVAELLGGEIAEGAREHLLGVCATQLLFPAPGPQRRTPAVSAALEIHDLDIGLLATVEARDLNRQAHSCLLPAAVAAHDRVSIPLSNSFTALTQPWDLAGEQPQQAVGDRSLPGSIVAPDQDGVGVQVKDLLYREATKRLQIQSHQPGRRPHRSCTSSSFVKDPSACSTVAPSTPIARSSPRSSSIGSAISKSAGGRNGSSGRSALSRSSPTTPA